MHTDLLTTHSPEELARAVARAAELLAAGEVVALPTETVYGLAADALRPAAVVKIFEAKERPFFDPLIVHLPDRSWLERLADIPAESQATVDALLEKFWPGPLTLVLPRRDIVPDLVTAGLGTVAVRMSAHPVFRAVAAAFGRPLAAPSANRFGRISPTAAAHVVSELGGRIPLVVDGGATAHGIESTIVAVEGRTLRILRSGPVTREELAQCGDVQEAARGERPDAPDAPGQLASHYAPATRLTLVDSSREWNATVLRTGLLARVRVEGEDYSRFAHVEWLGEDPREAAATLFASMRRLDEAGLDAIVAERVPETGLGVAIMDRLRKAAHV